MNPKNKSNFYFALLQELMTNLNNWYGKENWDLDGSLMPKKTLRDIILTDKFKKFLSKKGVILPRHINRRIQNMLNTIQDSIEGLSTFYNLLRDENSKSTLIKVIAYRILGYRKVKLPLNNPSYWRQRNYINSLARTKDTLKINFLDWKLNKFELDEIGYSINVYSRMTGIMSAFILKQ